MTEYRLLWLLLIGDTATGQTCKKRLCRKFKLGYAGGC